MHRHRFDPLSGALGIVVVIAAVVAIGGRLIEDVDAAPLLAIGALVLGLGLVPWSALLRRSPRADASADPYVSGPVPPGRDEF